MTTAHERVDFDHWASVFPIETFQKTSGPRLFSSGHGGTPVNFWKPSGEIITSWHNCARLNLFENSTRRQKTWVAAQFCFMDSKDIVSNKIPDDVMLLFFKDAENAYGPDAIHVEWSSIDLESPMTNDQCPEPSFVVPQLAGHIYRTTEYPDSMDVFEQEGHESFWLFPTTQSTKIGRETFFIQDDPRGPEEELLCALNSIHPASGPSDVKWPFIDLETLPDDGDKSDNHDDWGDYRMMFSDVGCFYFVIDESGRVRWVMDSY